MKKRSSKLTISLLLLFALFSSETYSQVKINCCGINLVIPLFKEDSISSEKNNVLLVKGILQPIRQSTSTIELRLQEFPYGQPGPVTVVKCDKSGVSVNRFSYYFETAGSKDLGSYKNIGPLPGYPKSDIFLYIDSSQKLTKGSWNDFFKGLIDNNFFNSPNEDSTMSAVLKKYPGIQIYGDNGLHVQVKVGNQVRSMNYSIIYDARIRDDKDYQNLMNMYGVLNLIK